MYLYLYTALLSVYRLKIMIGKYVNCSCTSLADL